MRTPRGRRRGTYPRRTKGDAADAQLTVLQLHLAEIPAEHRMWTAASGDSVDGLERRARVDWTTSARVPRQHSAEECMPLATVAFPKMGAE
ncbi:hypothetical protein WR25_11781 [Diploscapter pachys]|uniref:Uncharacterized protein n=1 Tax=Diploscapter pachys TaxID=2018661 RepID=A0A2A2J959_9BILA|nr:hypothetical protein WR25_11781 [Diploscapter pachys]